MMIVMKAGASEAEIESVIRRIESVGAHAHPSRGEEVTIIGAIGDREHVARLGLEGHDGVEKVVPILKPYKLASREIKGDSRTVLDIGGAKIGGDHFALIAGPCTVETRDQTLDTHDAMLAARATMVRGGAHVPRRRQKAANVALRLPGPGRRGAAAARRGQGAHRPADRHRADGRP